MSVAEGPPSDHVQVWASGWRGWLQIKGARMCGFPLSIYIEVLSIASLSIDNSIDPYLLQNQYVVFRGG